MKASSKILDAISDAVFLAESDTGILIECNRQAEVLVGRARDEIIGQPQVLLHPPEHAAAIQELFRTCTESERYVTTPAWVLHRDGHRIPVEISSGRFILDGRPVVAGVFRDLTTRRDAEAQLQLIADALPVVIAYVDADLRLQFVNRSYEEWFAMPRQGVLGKSVKEMHGPASFEQVEKHIDRTLGGEEATFEGRLEGLDRFVRLLFVPHRAEGGHIQGFFALMSDITEVKEREARQLEEIREQRDTLVREVHHRIKNHLQGLMGLLRNHATQSPAARPALENAIAQVQAVAIVHGLQSHDVPRRVRLAQLVRAIGEAFGLPDFLEIEEEAEEGQAARIADPEAVPVALILNELVANALKHRDPAGGMVHVRIFTTAGQAQVTITNPCATPAVELDMQTGKGLGTGLRLVRSLLPPKGMTLTLQPAGGRMLVVVELQPPLIILDKLDTVEGP